MLRVSEVSREGVLLHTGMAGSMMPMPQPHGSGKASPECDSSGIMKLSLGPSMSVYEQLLSEGKD